MTESEQSNASGEDMWDRVYKEERSDDFQDTIEGKQNARDRETSKTRLDNTHAASLQRVEGTGPGTPRYAQSAIQVKFICIYTHFTVVSYIEIASQSAGRSPSSPMTSPSGFSRTALMSLLLTMPSVLHVPTQSTARVD